MGVFAAGSLILWNMESFCDGKSLCIQHLWDKMEKDLKGYEVYFDKVILLATNRFD